MPSASVEIVIVLLLIVINGLFAMSEAAVISARKARLQQRADAGDKQAQAALELIEAPGTFLATTQIGITLIGILAGAFSGASISDSLASTLISIFPGLETYSHSIALVVVLVTITGLSLVIGELVPKNLALNNPERIASAVAVPMRFLARTMSPLVILLNSITRLILRLMNVKPSPEPAVTEEEIKQMVKQGAETGTFEQAESRIVEKVFRLDDLRVSSIMTPRTEIAWLDVDDPPEISRQKIIDCQFACYPLIKDTPDNVIGIVRAKTLLTRQYRQETFDLQGAAVPPLFVPGATTALRMLDIFKQENNHIALVIDEYGGLQGMITMEDILGELVGDALSGMNDSEAEILVKADGSMLVDGMLLIDKLKDVLHLPALPDEDDYETLGGLVMAQLGDIPAVTDHFDLEGWRFEVLDMDGHRVDKVLVQRQEATSVPDDA